VPDRAPFFIYARAAVIQFAGWSAHSLENALNLRINKIYLDKSGLMCYKTSRMGLMGGRPIALQGASRFGS
jgi:hypothetical protein